MRLAGASEVTLLASRADAQGKTVSAVTQAAELFIPLGDLVDFAKELKRLEKEREGVANYGYLAVSERYSAGWPHK